MTNKSYQKRWSTKYRKPNINGTQYSNTNVNIKRNKQCGIHFLKNHDRKRRDIIIPKETSLEKVKAKTKKII